MNNNTLELFSITKFYTLLFVLFMLEIANMFFMNSSLNMLVCIPEFLIVLYFLLLKKSLDIALLLHIIFSLTTFSVSFALHDKALMSYTSLKLFGPLTIAYIILGLMWLISLSKPIKTPRYSLIYKTRKLCVLLFSIASVFAFLGVLFFNYNFSHIIGPFLYMGICVLYLDIFVRLYNEDFLKSCYIIAVALLISSPIASFVSFNLLGIKVVYSVFDTFIMNEVFMLTPLLILFFANPIDKKIITAICLGLLCYLLLIVQSGRGGHFLNIAICTIFFVYLLYFIKSKDRNIHIIQSVLRLLFPFLVFVLSGYIVMLSLDTSSSLANAKLSQFFSLFSVFSGGRVHLDNLANSPYMRITEFLNIFDNGWQNPLLLLFGKGYGGTYTDSLGLFMGIDLTDGSFSEAEALSGVFSTAHSMYPNVLLYHGLIGLIIFIRHGIFYLKRIKYTPLVFAAFTLFLYSFYFNVILLIACLFILFAAEYKIQYCRK